jgi:hypothetical protein
VGERGEDERKKQKTTKAQLKKTINFLDVFFSTFLLWKPGRVMEKGGGRL